MSEFDLKTNRIKRGGLLLPVQTDKTDSRFERMENPLAGHQQKMGNQASLRFAQSCPLSLPSPSLCPTGGACHTCPAKIQAKLTIGRPDDKYEQEADRVAEQVMSMPEPRIKRLVEPEEEEEESIQTKPLADQITPLVQRQVEPEEEEEEESIQAKLDNNSRLQRQAEEEETEEPIQSKLISAKKALLQRQVEDEEEEEKPVQAKQDDSQKIKVAPTLERQINALKESGQPLPKPARNFFEPRFGADFNHVRLHKSSRAAEAANSVNAKAFTIGKDVFFGAGQYSPETSAGKRLLAHELTHILQRSKRGNFYLQLNENKKEEIKKNESTKKKLSGPEWYDIANEKWPNSKSIDDLNDDFESNVKNFQKILKGNKIVIHPDSTLRPKKRAYLMHYSVKVAKEEIKPKKVPELKGVDINWDHGDLKKSKNAAQKMAGKFGLAHPASLTSNHIEGKAIDMKFDFTNFNTDRKLSYKKDGDEKATTRVIKIDDEAIYGQSAKGKSIKNIEKRELSKAGDDFSVKRALNKDIVHWSVTGK